MSSRQQAAGGKQKAVKTQLLLLPTAYCLLPAVLLCVSLCGVAAAHAQQQPDVLVPAPQAAPPPMRYIPDALRAQLNAARDAKERTHLALAEADARLANAEQHTTAQQYDPAAAELGVYEAIITDSLTYLQGARNDGHTRDLIKLLEQTLYRQSSRIEAMRRNTPPQYAGNVRAAFNHARDTRSTALNAFYSTTVMREPPPDKNKPAPKGPPIEPAKMKPTDKP